MSTKRRRILEDDDSDEDVNKRKTVASVAAKSSLDSGAMMKDEPPNEDQKVTVPVDPSKDTIMRILRNTKKSHVKVRVDKPTPQSELVQEKKATSISIPRKALSLSQAPKLDEIPKKAKSSQTRDSNATLLTQSMLPLPPSSVPHSAMSASTSLLSPAASASAPAPAGTAPLGSSVMTNTSTNTSANTNATATATATTTTAPRDPTATTRRPKSTTPTWLTDSRLSPIRMEIMSDTDPSTSKQPSQQNQQQLSAFNSGPPPPPLPKLKPEEIRVLNTLKALCSKVNLQIVPSEDMLSGTFLSRPGVTVDEADRMFNAEDAQLRRIPIFPEEFTQAQPLWPLSWWGIVDPILENKNPVGISTVRTDFATGRSTTATNTAMANHTNPRHSDKDVQRVPPVTSTTTTTTTTTTGGMDHDASISKSGKAPISTATETAHDVKSDRHGDQHDRRYRNSRDRSDYDRPPRRQGSGDEEDGWNQEESDRRQHYHRQRHQHRRHGEERADDRYIHHDNRAGGDGFAPPNENDWRRMDGPPPIHGNWDHRMGPPTNNNISGDRGQSHQRGPHHRN